MHANLKFGNVILMASNSMTEEKINFGNSNSISIQIAIGNQQKMLLLNCQIDSK